MTSIQPDREHLLALALGGFLSDEQTEECLKHFKFRANSMQEAALASTLNTVCENLRARDRVKDKRLGTFFLGGRL